MKIPTQVSVALISVALIIAFANVMVRAEDVDFNRDIRPILSDRCFLCHGPDSGSNDSGLRLDLASEAVAELPSGEGHAIVAGDPEASVLLDRITTDDDSLVMPPPDSNLTLSEREIQLLRQWIEEGGEYEGHWAFQPLPANVPIPDVTLRSWPHRTLDHFVLEQLESNGLTPSPEAERWRWLRRVTFDLTGLPPKPDELSAFANDKSNEAYQKVVDRLLASSHFGEHLAVAWLDAARYADSYGYQSDKLNTQWPYRDWVVRAFNENLPYDDFLTWQLAGDLLPNPTRDQRLATAFNRIHRLNNEGGAVFEEWRIENVADRVHTFGTAVLGLTLECCRCHDHKYDPFSTRDYYSLSAFFNSIDESGVYDRSEKVPCPSLLLPTEAQQSAMAEATRNLEEAERDYQLELNKSRSRFERWRKSHQGPLVSPDLRLALGFDRPFDNSLKPIYHPSQSDRAWATMPELVTVEDSSIPPLSSELAADRPPAEDSSLRRAMLLDGERGITAHGITPFDRWTPFSVVVSMRDPSRAPLRSLIAHHTRGTDCGYNGWDLTIENGYLESRLYRVWPGNAIGVRATEPVPKDAWHQITATYDGSSSALGLELFLDGKRLNTTVLRDSIKKSANVKVDHGGEFVVGQRFRARGFADGFVDDVRVFTRALTEPELRQLATGQDAEPTFEYFASAIDEQVRSAWTALNESRHKVVMSEEAMHEVPVMQETQKPRPAHVLARGQYDAPTDSSTQVDRRTFTEFSLPFPENATRDRRGLAQWVTHPDHPLTARVAVNRLWANFFGQPLVRTPENFGLQGELPTHPQLLDWLARDFVESEWDVKRLCKNIVLSATYRQDSIASPDRFQKDPTNRWLARGPCFRLSAEQIRDLMLAASGLLNPEYGGPPVSPYQPGGDLWRESNGMSPPYQQSVGRALHRRSLYSIWKRTAPLPNMMAFDTTAREVCTVKRSRTNTPLQALVLLNDVQFVEAARAIAEQLLAVKGDENRIAIAFVRLVGRDPDPKERTVLLELLDAEKAHYVSHPDEASQLISIGDHPADTAESADLAALTTVCQAIINLDATIWRR